MKTILLVLLLIPMAKSSAMALSQETEEAAPKKIEHKEEWPELERKQATEVERAVAKLRKASSEVMEEEGRAILLDFGPASAPELLRALGKEKDEEARARITSLLERVTGAEHTRLLQPYFEHKSPELRRWCLRRCAAFPDAGTQAAAQAALKKALNPGKRKPVDAEEVYATALAACAAGDLGAMQHTYARAKQAWNLEGPALLVALGALKGEAASEQLIELLETPERKDQLMALRFLSGAGLGQSCVDSIAVFLDEQDSELLIAAINALRSIVENKQPLPRLSAFDAITKGKEWKAKLQ